MIDLDTIICGCNDLSVKDIVECIKNNNFNTLDELLKNNTCPIGDKCESCKDEGFNNDGYNIPYVLSLVAKKLI